MRFVALQLLVKELQLNTGNPEHIFAFGTCVVLSLANNSFNAAVDNQHCAYPARSHTAIQGGSVKRNAVFSSLANGILLSMNCAHAVLSY
jgi:hypothetical protein